MQRLFFLNGEQDLSSFLLVDLGIVKYPTYNCTDPEQVFKNRNDFLCYEEVCLIFAHFHLFFFFGLSTFLKYLLAASSGN